MNFRDLEYVVEASKCLSFSKAAEICNVSQPSLSAQIKKLEAEVGVDLFIRSNRRIYLTSFGESFVSKAKEILSVREGIYALSHQAQNPLEGRITLGGILTVAPYVFPKIVKGLRQEAPKIQLSLKEAKTEDLLMGILDGTVDAAILSLPTDDHVFESRVLFSESFYIAVSKDHELASKACISEKDLEGRDLILLEEGHCFRSQALDVCYSSSARENDMFNATSLETIRHFVAEGGGVTLMPAMARMPNDGIVYIPMDKGKFSRDIGVVWRKSSNKTPQIEKLLSVVEGVYQG
ncbi:MAG: LysR substrate-binding domain-containing protein [Alcanivorax sp.]